MNMNDHPKLTIHPSAHPKIFLAGGNILGKDSFEQFDGLILFAVGFNGFHMAALRAVEGGTIPVPVRFHETRDGDYTQSVLPDIIGQDLGILSQQGCRRIGIHTMHELGLAKTSVRAALEWVNKHPEAVDAVTFVDMKDDYYNCFGMDAFGTAKVPMINPEPTDFESYFEKRFREDLGREFPVSNDAGFPCCTVERKKVEIDMFTDQVFSVALFYLALVPQAIAKVCGNEEDMYAFCRLADWPMMSRGLGGWMAPGVYLEYTGMLPGHGDAAWWLRLAKAESGYFCRLITHYLVSGIRKPRNDDEVRLGVLTGETIKKIHREVRTYLDSFEKYLNGGPAPDNYYLPEDFRR